MNQDEKIQAYLDRELSDKESKAFENELAEDDEFLLKFENYLAAKEIAQNLVEFEVRATLDHVKEGYRESQRFLRWWWIVVVLGLAMLTYYFLIPGWHNQAPVFADRYEEPVWPITRSEGDSLSKIFSNFLYDLDVEKAKHEILIAGELTEEAKRYWISEMYLKVSEIDSAKKYLPSFDESHFRYQRAKRIRSWIK